MFSCCACTRPSKLDTEEVRSDETSDSDEDDESLEEDEKSDNDDQSSDDELSHENEEGIITERVDSDPPKSSVIDNEIQSPTKGSVSSPQNSSTSTEVLSQKISIENELSSRTKNDSDVLQEGSVEEKVSSPTKSHTEVESIDLPSLQKSPLFEKDDPRKIEDRPLCLEKSGCFEDEGPSPEKSFEENYPSLEESFVENYPSLEETFQDKYPVSEEIEDKVQSPEKTSNIESVVGLPEPVVQFPESRKLKEQIFQREMSQSFDDEDPSPENSSNTGSVVHIPSSIPDNEVTSPKKLLTPRIEAPSPENDISSLEKRKSFEEAASSPENKSITQMSSIITDNEAQEVVSPPKSPPPETEILIPPPETESYGLPPDIEGFVSPDESSEIFQPPDDRSFLSLPENEDYIPLPETDDIVLSDFIPPPENETFNSEPENGSFLPPQTEDLIPPQEYDDFIIPPPQNEEFLPPPENEEFLPLPENEIMTPSPENIVSSPQKSPTFDSDVPSPQNTWTSSSTDEEKRAIEITEFIGIIGNIKREKSPLHYAPAFIERTIDDGPEEEGDDSVFESYPTPPPPPEIDFDASRKTTVPPPIPQWLSQEDDDENISEGYGGMQEPPATPVARDELAMRRHRFFSDLLQATKNSAEHRVSFDPLGPTVHLGCESDDREEHLEELVTRLENVTRRLERVPQGTPETQEIAVQTKTPSPEKSPSPKKSLKESISSEDQCSIGSTSSISSAGSSIVEINNMSVAGYEDLVAGPVREYLALSKKIGGDVTAHSQLVEKAFQIQLQFIRTASSRPAPANQTEQVSLLGPTSTQIQQIQEFRDKHRASPFFNHLSAISESIPALGWVAVSPTPAPYVKEMNDAGQFYTNRVLKDWKEKDKTHVEWCKAWVQTLSELQQYVRKFHTTGLVWAKGGSIPPPPAGVPPPPPPSMLLGDMALGANDDRSALFAEINQGENITRNLKKVTSEMQTHKNPNLRTGPAPFKAPATTNSGSPMKNTLPANAPIDKPPVFTRDGKKWLVEYHKGNKNLLVEDAEMNNVIYMYRCQDSTLVIKGKVNSVVMDSCRKSSIVFDSLVSSIEFVNCQSVQMQVLGKVPTISIDKTDGCQMYLNPESMGVEVISSKSSEMNVMVPKGNGDYTEHPVPEQFKTTISPKGLSTVAVDSLG